MSAAASAVAAVAAPLVAEAAARGMRAPVRLIGVDARAWVVLERSAGSRGRDALLLDEFGDLWWGRPDGHGCARVTRTVWPEETSECTEAVRDRAAVILGNQK
jgi:hypothetical protein